MTSRNKINIASRAQNAIDCAPDSANDSPSGRSGPSSQLAGSKRKLNEDYVPDAENSPRESKRQSSGGSFFLAALLGKSVVKSISNFTRWLRGAPGSPEHDSELPVDADDANLPQQPIAVIPPAEGAIQGDEDEIIDICNAEPVAHPVVDLTEAPAVDAVLASTALAVEKFTIARPTSHYSPPVAKSVNPVKRSELKRKLREQNTQTAAPLASLDRPPTDDAQQPSSTEIKSDRPKSRSSRGARLLNLAHDAAPLKAVTLALAPSPLQPRHALFGIDNTPAPVDPDGLEKEDAVDDATLHPSPPSGPEDEEQQQQDGIVGSAEEEEVVVDEEEQKETAAAVACPEKCDMGDDVEKEAVADDVALVTETEMPVARTEDVEPADAAAATEEMGEEKTTGDEVTVAVQSGTQQQETASEPLATTNDAATASPSPTSPPQQQSLSLSLAFGIAAAPSPLMSPSVGAPAAAAASAPSAAAAVTTEAHTGADANTINNSVSVHFTPLPRLLPRFDSASDDAGYDSTPSSCSLLPKGLSGSRSPIIRKSKGAVCQDNDWEDCAVSQPGDARRVRFANVQEEALVEEEVDDVTPPQQNGTSSAIAQDGDAPLGGATAAYLQQQKVLPAPQSGVRLLPRRSASQSTFVPPVPPRFGFGAFVRKVPSNNGNISGAALSNSQDDALASANDGGSSGGSPTADATPPVIITRRLQGPVNHRRVSLMMLPPPNDSVPQMLREAFLNARLAEHWRRGEGWARLDLAGVEISADDTADNILTMVQPLMVRERGEAAVKLALEQLEVEWEHLKCMRQRYVSSPAAADDPSAPKSILKHASGVPPSPADIAAADHTPPLGSSGDGNSRRHLPGFEEILAAEIVPGSTGKQDFNFDFILCGGSTQQYQNSLADGQHQPYPQHAGGMHLTSAAAADCSVAMDLTPSGLNIVSRGKRMIASLHRAAANTTTTSTHTTTQRDSRLATRSTTNTKVRGKSGSTKLTSSRDTNRSATQSHNRPKKGSRGQRLLQALQKAAPSSSPITAAGAARLIVESAATGGDHAGDQLVTGPMATSFVVS